MARYAPFGNAIFGETLFGVPPTVSNYTTITIKPMGFDTLQLNWKPPGNASTWSQQILVRSFYGTPNNISDGVELLNETGTYSVQYVDTELVSGRFYYYTLFVYNTDLGEYIIAASAQGLVLTDYQFGKQYTTWLPEWYITLDDNLATTQQPVGPLVRYLNLLGYEMDWIRSEIESLFTLSNIELVSGSLLPYLGANYGMPYEYELGMIRSRILVKNAVALYKERGTLNGIQAASSAFSGFGCRVTLGPNIEIQLDDSAFDRSVGHWKPANGFSSINITPAGSAGANLSPDYYTGYPTVHGAYDPYPDTPNTPTDTGVAGYLPINNQNVAQITAGGMGDGVNWLQYSPNISPAPRQLAAMSPSTTSLTMFGGVTSGKMLNDTWKWEDFGWSNITPFSPAIPSGRWFPALAYDPRNETVVLFGGQNGPEGDLDDTWLWIAGQWELIPKVTPHGHSGPINPVGGPGFTMVYDGTPAAAGDIFMWGAQPGGFVNTMYRWTGLNWYFDVFHLGAPLPASRRYYSMVGIAGKLYLFGGQSGEAFAPNNTYFGDTWKYDPLIPGDVRWEPLLPTSSPNNRSFAAFAYDPDYPALGAVLFGGWDGVTVYNDTWVWDGTNWTLQSPMDSPPGVRNAQFSPDGLGNMILFGGITQTYNDSAETWLWDGTNWTQQFPAGNPPTTALGFMVYNGNSSVTNPFMFGGLIPPVAPPDWFQLTNNSWDWDGTTWTQLTTLSSPQNRMGASMVWDASVSLDVLFGGCLIFDTNYPANSVAISDIWTWDGSTWTAIAAASGGPPADRYNAAMIYNPDTLTSFVHGGSNFITGYLSDTWEWDATAYTWAEASTGGPAVANACFVFDTSTSQMILFGGNTPTGPSNQTWVFDGATWTMQATTSTPSPRFGARMAVVPSSGIYVYGGTNGIVDFDETWVLDSSTWVWTLHVSSTNPPAVANAVMDYDATTSSLVLFGGLKGATPTNQTWFITSSTVDVPIELSTTSIVTAQTLGIPIEGVPLDLEQATPFEPSTVYVLSAYFQGAPGSIESLDFKTQIDWYGKNGDLISSDTGASVTASAGGWVEAYVVASPPFGAYSFGRTVTSDTPIHGQLYYMDAEQVEINTQATPGPTSWSPPRDIRVNLIPVRQNLVVNAQFLAELFNWTEISGNLFYSSALSPPFPNWPDGTFSGALGVCDGAGQLTFLTTALINSGISYTFSLYSSPLTAARSFYMIILFLDHVGSVISTSTSVATEQLIPDTFTRSSMTVPTAPDGAVEVVLAVSLIDGAPSEEHWFTGFMLEPSDFEGPYFDGTFSPPGDYIFEGTPNESVSDYYPQLLTKVSRLSEVLVDYVPIGATFSLVAGAEVWTNLGLYTG